MDGLRPSAAPALPKAPARPPADPVAASTLATRIDQFLASRGVTKPEGAAAVVPRAQAAPAPAAPSPIPVSFVCEEDVRTAQREGRTILVGERTIITPAARDTGAAARVFVWEGWRS
jgi:hypothetical protein